MKRLIVCLIVLTAHALPAIAQDAKEKKRKPGFTVGKDTTFVDGPLDKFGYIDYEAALSERLSKGVTPENNVNALLWKTLAERARQVIFEPLGIGVPHPRAWLFLSLTSSSIPL